MNPQATLDTQITPAPETAGPRGVTLHRGRQHGPIVRLVSPSNVGERIKPFVFLDHGELEPTGHSFFGIHPHSGIATLTVVLSGALAYADTTGKQGEIVAGGLEWMKAGNGVWHDGWVPKGDPMRFFQLWIALPPSLENSPPESQYVPPSAVPQAGPARVVLGQLGQARSAIAGAPAGIDYFHVQLEDGAHWQHTPSAGHDVAWLAVDRGRLKVGGKTVADGVIAVFEESQGDAIEVQAEGNTSFVFGSAIRHPHPLVLGEYSIHTNADALARGQAEIRRIGRLLRPEGRR
ncbi:pirin family protein [Solimonas sp. K1W22B-7]|uniref:pirin family protein n=1 Tax=Solimonas sp. K1W22B-7 TaxID=2303331 RepID=UPI000E3326C2|nr:pirin family protein [Solimonas sp. K1W22B-7]AXQ31462.1 pirin family protein [Solimonas sp. K1W22B-7]